MKDWQPVGPVGETTTSVCGLVDDYFKHLVRLLGVERANVHKIAGRHSRGQAPNPSV